MRLFKKRREELSGPQAALAERIAAKILQFQLRAAAYLNTWTAGISVAAWKMILVVFCLCFGSYCLWLVVQAF